MKNKIAEKNHFLKKQKSPIHGLGVFTIKPIKKGQRFYKISLDSIVSKPHKRYAKIGENRFVNDPILNWVNHSCNANTRLVINIKEPYLIALQDITAGSEVVCDYNETEVGGIKVECKCDDKDCRGYFLRVE